MNLYHLCVVLHIGALSLWLGHMFVWSLVVGPAIKRVQPTETAAILRERSLYRGGLGWPALSVLIPTGLYLLSVRGITPGMLLTGGAFVGIPGAVLAVKLAGVCAMMVYQAVIGHRQAPVAAYLNMLVALVIIGASVVLVRGWV